MSIETISIRPLNIRMEQFNFQFFINTSYKLKFPVFWEEMLPLVIIQNRESTIIAKSVI